MAIRKARSPWLKVVAFGIVALALSACAHRKSASLPSVPPSSASPNRVSATPSDKGDPTGQEVLAIVERMELNAHTENLSDGSVIVSNTVAFGIVEPRRLDTLLIVHTRGLPIIGTRRVQLGDVAYFVLPHNWRNRDLELADLENLRFRD